MKAVTVVPRTRGSVQLRELPEPSVNDVPDGRGVLVQVLRVGLDGTDREILQGEYGAPPEGSEFLVLGHESLGLVRAVGPAVTEVVPGDLVVARVRRAGTGFYDRLGMPDMTTDAEVLEHGISRLHGFLRSSYVEDPEYLIAIPSGLRDVAVLLEPTSVVEKGIRQAWEIQRRLKVWHPARAAVMGAGTIGLLATMALRSRGLEVVTIGLEQPPYLNSELAEAVGASYLATSSQTIEQISERCGRFDVVFEATGYSPIVFDASRLLLAKNGVMVLTSVTGGSRTIEVPSDALNLELVLGNKVLVGSVNANREHFEEGVRDLAVAEARWPGWLARLLTHDIDGLDEWETAFELLGAPGAIKVTIRVTDPE
jgi:threonine dehydrogenase-like Zn-dependent dehydrogenase